MKRNLALVWAATAAVGCHALSIVSMPAASRDTSAQVFADVADGSLFGACMQAVHLAEAPGVTFSKACADAFSKSGAQASSVNTDCAELAGRASEAVDEHFLGDGRLMCGRLIRERAFVTKRPLASFAPAEAGASVGAFCDVMRSEALSFCMPTAAAMAAFAVDPSSDSVLPPAAVAAPQAQATPALRAAEAKPARLAFAPTQPLQQQQLPQQLQPGAAVPQQLAVQQAAARLFAEPAVTPQLAEAAQTIAAGVFPAFAYQVPQVLAAGLLSALAMNAKAA